MSAKISRLIRSSILELNAYPVPSAAGMIKLDAMENPFSMPEHLLDAWSAVLRKVELNRYPQAGAEALKRSFAEVFDIPSGLDLMFGNGSDELIQLLCMAVIAAPFCQGRKPVVLAPEPGFVMYRYLAQACDLEYIGVPLRQDDFELQREHMLQAIERHRPALIFLAYPNNPTGNVFANGVVEEIIAIAPGLVIIDEAYQPFAEASYLQRLSSFDNVLLLRTVSKLGLAGIRLGALIGSPSWLRQLEKLRLPYNINSLTQATMLFVLENYVAFAGQAEQIRQERERLYKNLNSLQGLSAYPSRANFLLFRLRDRDADSMHEYLKAQGILLKNVSHAHPLLAQCLRVTIGTAEENQLFLSCLRTGLKK